MRLARSTEEEEDAMMIGLRTRGLHLALKDLRGSQCGNPFAETFLAEKVVLPDGSAQPAAVRIRRTGLPR
ncbi:hypothetical protein ACIBED_15265 [Rhodococcus coprophilus]|uniref:Uncharacterized protein n=1 Tax=Rhodococcus coprophilus TaxID=38310 RepID=A0A2X4U7V6_9NOCA|nr:hypothetical protein [Rhodococcus coprophilus]MBM7457829.1 hypothetical protein [Rhodococcus coprophilus]SQI30452.1 Uncharacterised protein [Rhodococcus coprophilus]